MNIYNFDVNFTTGRIYAPDFILVVNDHNSTLFKFTFDQIGRYVFKLLYPDGTVYVQDIADNQLKLTKGVLNQEGNYKFEISLYGDDNRLTTARIKEFPVRLELVSTDEPVQADDRLPILDNLIEETNKVVEAAKNGELDGATFTPSVSDNGDLSWTNDKGKENPPTVNIKGEKGDPGAVKMQVVDTLPDVGETDTIYLLKKDKPGEQNLYDEYVYTETTGWEHIGDTSVDLTDYYTKDEADSRIEGLYTLCVESFDGNNPFDSNSADTKNRISEIVNDAYQKGLHTFTLILYSKSSSRSIILNISGTNVQEKPTSILLYGLLIIDGLNYKIQGLNFGIKGTWSNNIFTCNSAGGMWAHDEIRIANSNNYLSKTNTISYTPSEPYNPATKKYVDDNKYTLPVASAETLGGIKLGEGLSVDENGVVSASGEELPLVYLPYGFFSNRTITDNDFIGKVESLINDNLNEFKSKRIAAWTDNTSAPMKYMTYNCYARVSTAIKSYIFYGDSIDVGTYYDKLMVLSSVIIVSGSWVDNHYSITSCNVKFVQGHKLTTPDTVLTKTNTTAYTPTSDYHPATKKYVDDSKVTKAGVLEYLEEENVYILTLDNNINPNAAELVQSLSGVTDTQLCGYFAEILSKIIPKKSGTLILNVINIDSNRNMSNSAIFQWSSGSHTFYTVGIDYFGCRINYLDITYTNTDGVYNVTRVKLAYKPIKSQYTPTDDTDVTNKKYVDGLPKSYAGYDATKTQVLKNINGTLTWVTEG